MSDETLPDVHLLTLLPDGSAIGADDDGNAYRGTPTEVPYDQMTVTTDVAKDGASFVSTVRLPDGTIHGQGVTYKDDFVRSYSGQQVATTGEMPSKADVEAAWQEQCEISSLDATVAPARVYSWTAI